MDPLLRLRLVAWYAAAVGSITVIPWLAVSLADAGLDESTTAAALLLVPASQLTAGPAWSWLADRLAAPHVVLRLCTALTAIAGVLLVAADRPAAMIGAVVLWAVCRAPVFPLADALTVRLLGEHRRDYGRIRGVGSMVYLVAMLAGGFLRESWPRAPLILGAGLLVATALVTLTLPVRRETSPRPRLVDLARAAAHPGMLPLIGVCVLQGVTITTYDTLFSLHVEGLGHGPSVTGMAVAVGVAVEVVLMLQGRRLIDGWGPLPLFAVAIAAGIPRWLLTAIAADAWVLAGVQALHGVQFGLFWIAAVALFSERAPPALASSVQSLLPASTFGGGYLLSMACAAVVLREAGTSTLFAICAAVSLAATLGAVALARRS